MKKMNISFKDNGNYLFDILDNNYKIATVELLFIDSKYWLNQITLEGDCHEKKYGPEIISQLKSKYETFRISLSSKNYHNIISKLENDTRYLTRDGFKLAKKCFEQGILSRKHFEFPFKDELREYKSERFLNNKTSNILNFFFTIISKLNTNQLN